MKTASNPFSARWCTVSAYATDVIKTSENSIVGCLAVVWNVCCLP